PPTMLTLSPYTTLFRSHDAEVLIAHPAANLQRRRQADESTETRVAEELRTHLLRNLLRRQRSRGARHELHHEAAVARAAAPATRSEEHTSELQSRVDLV